MKRRIKQITLIVATILCGLTATAQTYRSFTTDKVPFNANGMYYTLPKTELMTASIWVSLSALASASGSLAF